MKRFVLALAAMVITAGVFAQTAATAKVVTAESAVKFKEFVHDFGKIKQSVPVTYEFSFTNTTNKPIVIESASASCGCTTPVWPQTPIAKGKTDKITAGFNAQNLGPFNKSIYVKVAGIDKPVEIKITGEVLNAVDFAKYEKENSKKSK
jgi:Protein of unknown function (DUF1573)